MRISENKYVVILPPLIFIDTLNLGTFVDPGTPGSGETRWQAVSMGLEETWQGCELPPGQTTIYTSSSVTQDNS